VDNQEENQIEPSGPGVDESVGQAEEPMASAEPDMPEAAGERRGFIKFFCAFIGTLISVVPFGAGIWAYLDPLAKREGGAGDGFIKVTTLDAIPTDGSPAKFAVVADKVDAWNRFTNVSIGAVYLRLVDGVPKALHTICPHLGCFVDYRQGKNDFFCPCHDSNFALDGTLKKGVSPRGMDSLEVELRNGSEVWVKFQRFKANASEKIAIG
jgi:nitrite reductase/ring-hydroxylating ferredoxin subunit